MKKKFFTMVVLSKLLTAIVVLGTAAQSYATPFSDTYDWYESGTYENRTYEQIGDNSNSFNYSWSQVINFNPDAASVEWATLTLSYIKNSQTSGEFWFLSGSNNQFIGNLVHAQDSWVDQQFDISSLLASFSGSSFTVALKLTEKTSATDKIYLDQSVIRGDYTSVTQPPTSTPVPEPATMLLVGTGLAGIIGVRRRKKA